jgi:hypothetical protein
VSDGLPYRPLSEVWVDAAEYLVSPPKGVRLPWWPTLSTYLLGLRAHELTLVCAPTGTGKTELLANIAAQTVLQDTPTFVAPVETGDLDFAVRLMGCADKRFLNTGDAVAMEAVSRMTAAHAGLLRKPMYISTYDNRVDVGELCTTLRYMHQAYGCQIALLDNLNFFLEITAPQEQVLAMDHAVHSLVMLKKQVPMHIMLIVHPRKTDGGRVESEFDIKGSSTSVQEADNVLLFNRPRPSDIEAGRYTQNDRELVFKKIRKRGMHVNKPVWLTYQHGRYMELQ